APGGHPAAVGDVTAQGQRQQLAVLVYQAQRTAGQRSSGLGHERPVQPRPGTNRKAGVALAGLGEGVHVAILEGRHHHIAAVHRQQQRRAGQRGLQAAGPAGILATIGIEQAQLAGRGGHQQVGHQPGRGGRGHGRNGGRIGQVERKIGGLAAIGGAEPV
nr:hypothetical protein [Tanacetum cinerariifolium]